MNTVGDNHFDILSRALESVPKKGATKKKSFADMTAAQIASKTKSDQGGDVAKAIRILNFKINSDKTLSDAVKAKMKSAVISLKTQKSKDKTE